MFTLSFMPTFIASIFKDLPVQWKSHHYEIFLWGVLLQAITFGKRNISEKTKWIKLFKEWQFRRFLSSKYWSIHFIIEWLANKIIEKIAPPEQNIFFIVVDGSHKNKTGKKNPYIQNRAYALNFSIFPSFKRTLIR